MRLDLNEVTGAGSGFIDLTSGHMPCYRESQETKEHMVGFSIKQESNLFCLREIVAAAVIKIYKRCRLKIVTAYRPTTSYDDEAAESVYEDVE